MSTATVPSVYGVLSVMRTVVYNRSYWGDARRGGPGALLAKGGLAMPGVGEFLSRVRRDESLYARIASNPDSVMDVAAAEGFEFGREELVGHLKALRESGELSDEELEGVAGGKGDLVTEFMKLNIRDPNAG